MKIRVTLFGTICILLTACASMSPFPKDNPSRYSEAQQTKTIDLLTQAEALLHTCLDQKIVISRIELTSAPDQELWHISSCTGKQHSYRVSLLANGDMGLQDLRTRQDVQF